MNRETNKKGLQISWSLSNYYKKNWWWKKMITFHANCIIYSLISLLLFRIEERLVALPVPSSFRRVATSGFQNNSAATSSSSWVRQAVVKWRVNTESLHFQHSTAARQSYWNETDVTRLIATEDVQNKYSVRESIILQLGHATYSSGFVKVPL